MSSTIDQEEVKKFSAIAKEWWNESGKFKPLHLMNPVRISYIKEHIKNHYNIYSETLPFKNLNILDIGCGGGILSEPIARLGATMHGIDASEQNINIAKEHAKFSQLNINYSVTTVEDYATVKDHQKFDVILAMEIVEHVQNIELFITKSLALLNPGGLIFFSTINRTIKSYCMAIIGAEYLLRLLPVGTHEWNKFIKPSEINSILIKNKTKIIDIKGLKYNPLFNHSWSTSDHDIDVNYIFCAKLIEKTSI